MPIALVTIQFHPIRDDKCGTLRYIDQVKIVTIDNNLRETVKIQNFPSVYDGRFKCSLSDEEIVSSANKVIGDINKIIEENLKNTSTIYVSTKLEKQLLMDIFDQVPIQVIY